MTNTKTRSVCLICLKRFGGDPSSFRGSEVNSVPLYQSRLLAPHHGPQLQGSSFSECGGNGDLPQPRDLYSRFLLLTSRYLRIPASETFLHFAKEHKKSTGETVQAFCGHCQELVRFACDLHVELQTIRLHLLMKMDELEKVTRQSTRNVSLKMSRSLLKLVTEQLNIKSVRQLDLYRKSFMLSCNRKVKKSTPQVQVCRGLIPEEWKFTYLATKQALMRLIVIFALATPPVCMKMESESKKGILKDGSNQRRFKDRRKVGFEELVFITDLKKRRPGRPQRKSATDESGVVVKEEGTVVTEASDDDNNYFDADDGAFSDTGRDDNDSDWSTGAASPSGCVDSAGSDVNFNDDGPVPAKRRRLRSTRQRMSSSSLKEVQENESDQENEDDPDFDSKVSPKKNKRRPPPLSLKDATIPCTLCRKKFVDRRGLAKHLRDIHNTRIDYICNFCGFKCKTSAEYHNHKRSHPGYSVKDATDADNAKLPCPKCKRKFVDARGLSRHMMGTHNSRLEYSCHLCGHKSKSAADHMSHKIKMHKKERPRGRRPRRGGGVVRIRRELDTACRDCEKQFASREEYLQHNKEVHNSNYYKFECPVCMKQVTNDQRFKRHLVQHEKDSSVLKIFHCEACGKTFNSEGALSDHFVSIHDGSYACFLCTAKYPASSLLRNHLETHETDTKNFFCTFCFRGYTNEQYFQIHTKVAHVGSERIFCDQEQCAEEFNNVQDLNVHLKVHIDELKAKDAAEATEKSQEAVDETTVATDQKPIVKEVNSNGCTEKDETENQDPQDEADKYKIFTCGTCGWGFLKKYSLTLHELVHVPYEKEIPGYRCPMTDCDKSMRLKDKLISHYNHAHGEKLKPYTCRECGHNFSHFIWFKTHLRLHEERKSGRKFICGICNTECLDSINLAAHKRTHDTLKEKKVVLKRSLSPKDGKLPKRRPGRPRIKERSEEELKREQEELEKYSNVPCEVCAFACGSHHLLRKHLESEHEEVPEEEKKIQCSFCYMKFMYDQSHKLHCISFHMQKYRFVCDAERCDAKFENHLDLNEHLKNVHLESSESGSVEATPATGTETSPEEQAENKVVGENKNVAVSNAVKVQSLLHCRFCDWGFVNPDFLELHELCHIPMSAIQTYPCPECTTTFPSIKRLTSHYNFTHGKSLKPYKCLECPAAFFEKLGLRNHIGRHDRRRHLQPDDRFICLDCGRQFKDNYLLTYHKKSHNPDNHVICPEGCGEKFDNKTKLSVHLKRIHDIGEKYPCPECGVSFHYQHETNKHLLWTHGPPKFECDMCDRKYRRPGALRKHKRKHNPDLNDTESYICSECGNHYKSAEGLKFHMGSVHTPDDMKKFACPECPYRTHRRMLWKMHIEVCFRNRGIPYNEEKFGKLPPKKKYTGPPRKRGRRVAKKKKEEEESEEEMEEKSTTDEEEDEEEQKPETSFAAPQQAPVYPHQQPQSAPSSSNANVINAIIANLTGIPDIGSINQSNNEEATPRRGRRRNNRQQSKESSSTSAVSSTIDHTVFQSMAQPPQMPHHPQLFGNNLPAGMPYQSWLNSTSAGPGPSSLMSGFAQHSLHQSDNSNESKPDFNHTPPPTHQQQYAAYSPDKIYSPPQNLQYSGRK